MEGIKAVAFVFLLWGFYLRSVHCLDCEIVKKVSGKISSVYELGTLEKCYKIPVPRDDFISLKFISIKSNESCEYDNVRIEDDGTKTYKFCRSNFTRNPTSVAGRNVSLIHYVYFKYTSSSFEVDFIIRSKECMDKSSFECDKHSCIYQKKVCDGVRDCKDGKDEVDCGPSVQKIEGVSKARGNAVSWLKQRRTAAWDWKEYTPRAIVALYLASAASFDGTVIEDQLMAKQAELKIAVALLRPSLTNSELSMFIHALLVTRVNPRHFHGHNLVKRLKDQVEGSKNYTHPLAYLALCNANESWPVEAMTDLNNILNSDSEYPFVKDLQAIGLMALSCEANRTRNFDDAHQHYSTRTLYKNKIQYFKKQQDHDGSFGTVYTTALITQALLSSGQERIDDWKLNAAITYLMQTLKSPYVNFLATYLTLPILNVKSLVDILYVNHSPNAMKLADNSISKSIDYLGPKMRVQYTLYIGDDKDVIHSISFKVPKKNYKAFEIMELAAVENPLFKFEWKKTSGKMYLYETANITNDPEDGKFWLLFVGAASNSDKLTHFKKGPDEVSVAEGETLVLWYKTATI